MNKTSITWKEFVAYVEGPEHYVAIDNGLVLDRCYYNKQDNQIEINWRENDLLFEYYFNELGQEILPVIDGEIVRVVSDDTILFNFRFLKAVKL
jgi:hypothetical protein